MLWTTTNTRICVKIENTHQVWKAIHFGMNQGVQGKCITNKATPTRTTPFSKEKRSCPGWDSNYINSNNILKSYLISKSGCGLLEEERRNHWGSLACVSRRHGHQTQLRVRVSESVCFVCSTYVQVCMYLCMMYMYVHVYVCICMYV